MVLKHTSGRKEVVEEIYDDFVCGFRSISVQRFVRGVVHVQDASFRVYLEEVPQARPGNEVYPVLHRVVQLWKNSFLNHKLNGMVLKF